MLASLRPSASLARAPGLARDEIAPEVERRFKRPIHASTWSVYRLERIFIPEDIENSGPKLAVDSTLEDLRLHEG